MHAVIMVWHATSMPQNPAQNDERDTRTEQQTHIGSDKSHKKSLGASEAKPSKPAITGNVSGMLLYAKTDEVVLPNNEYKMGGNAISVKTLDLDCDFSMIREQLDGIVQSCFELE